jgi:UDP-3-O-[3-hydroxymyristoyl] glucosamine N-acyltransferase
MKVTDLLETLREKEIQSLNKDLQVTTISIPEEVTSGSLVFISHDKYLKRITPTADTDDILLVVPRKYYEDKSKELETYSNLVIVKDLGLAMNKLSKVFYDQIFKNMNFQLDGRKSGEVEIDPDTDIAPNVFIGENVKIAKDCKIHTGAVIMSHVEIGENTEIFPNVTIYPLTKIGSGCRIHSGTIIGADGFGYNFSNGAHLKVWHFGGVEIHNDVEIGSNTSVDMGAFTTTVIGEGTKIDNFCQVSHNSKIGKHCIFCGRSGVSGSCHIEDFVIFGAGAGAAPGVHLKTGTQVAACAIISENAVWGPNEVVAGHPARPLKEYMKTQAKLNLLAKKK